MKQNCWGFKGCGREPEGSKAGELGICPATTAEKLNGIHGGKNAGRACWVVAGTFCGSAIQETFTEKYITCTKCDFYCLVRKEEGMGFITAFALRNMLVA